MKNLAILGSTGSIGVNALDVASALEKDGFKIVALSADSNVKLLSEQSRRFRPRIIAVRDSFLAKEAAKLVPAKTKVTYGIDGLNEIVSRNDVDLIVFAISGSSCTIPLIKAIRAGKKIALANKESIVSAGSVITRLAKKNKVDIIPVDSEHSAIFQCLEGKRKFLNKIYLTGSGGPLLNIPKNNFDAYSRKFVLTHPKWRMGKKISVDSATMMNKGLEIIEARWLFDIDQNSIDVLIHPEAVIHSMIELIDGTVFAQMAVPDMRGPIQYALTYPHRHFSVVKKLDFITDNRLSFRAPDTKKFPCLKLASLALQKGGTYPAVLNAANEETVKDYLDGRIKFSTIPNIIEKVLERHRGISEDMVSIDGILDAEKWAKEEARSLCYH